MSAEITKLGDPRVFCVDGAIGRQEDWISFEYCQYSNYQTQDEEDLNRVNAFSQVKKELPDRYLKVSKDQKVTFIREGKLTARRPSVYFMAQMLSTGCGVFKHFLPFVRLK